MNDMEKMVSVIEIKAWLSFGTVLILLAIALIWGFFGTMRLQEETSGVIVRSGRVFNIYAAYDTVLLDFTLQPNQHVERGQVIARIEQLSLVTEINLLIEQNAPEAEIRAKQDELIARSQIKTYDYGRVMDVFARSGDFIRRGERIATIMREAPGTRALECLLFIPINQAKYIQRGMTVDIFPAGVSRKNYGNMIGTVLSVSEFPVTFQYLYDVLGSEELARTFLRDGAVHEVYVVLVASEETTTGYNWTTSKGPNKTFGNLTMVEASVVREVLRPIDVFFNR
ncbi:MAG: hypothetical protein FWC16_02100 [Defluviitaleaceae bacterium]|nr:hypothetical protein [Defluviitaleaceae bacterium]MCL2273692.1 hypothetical protein [Defluviitaleaceae bacterium]